MELEQHDDRESKRPHTEPAAPRDDYAAISPPLASEGLEQVRDSHC